MLVTGAKNYGTIGGGRSEFLLVEKAKKIVSESAFVKPQLCILDHRDDDSPNASGMICSGSQTYALIPLTKKDKLTIENITKTYKNGESAVLTLSPRGLFIDPCLVSQTVPFSFEQTDNEQWKYKEQIGVSDKLYIVGGGHCSLALSKLTTEIGFYTTVYENRSSIQAFDDNIYANEKIVVDYDDLPSLIPDSDKTFITIMTYGHAYDQYVLEKLVHKKVRYLGMMGSMNKVRSVYDNLIKKGIAKELLLKVHAPIGIDIGSDTPEEIAISIAAQLIKLRNKY